MDSLVSPAALRIVLIDNAVLFTADVLAARVLWAVYTVVSIPALSKVDLIHLAMVSFPTGL